MLKAKKILTPLIITKSLSHRYHHFFFGQEKHISYLIAFLLWVEGIIPKKNHTRLIENNYNYKFRLFNVSVCVQVFFSSFYLNVIIVL